MGWWRKERRKKKLCWPKVHICFCQTPGRSKCWVKRLGENFVLMQGDHNICSHYWGETSTDDNPTFLFTKYLTSLDFIWVLWLYVEVEIELKPNISGFLSYGTLYHQVGSEGKPDFHSNVQGNTIVKLIKIPRGLRVQKELWCALLHG